jgi:RNA-directed DNA polymerase
MSAQGAINVRNKVSDLQSKLSHAAKSGGGGLGGLGLKLHPDKTRVVKAEEGFDFLGVHLRLCPVRKKNSKLKKYCALWPSERSIGRIKQRIREVVGRRYSLSLEELIGEMTPIIRG